MGIVFSPQSRAGQGGADLTEQLQRELGPAAEKEADHPLQNIAHNMADVSRRMMQADAGAATRAIQKQIVDDLDRLIGQAHKSAGQASSSAPQEEQFSNRRPSDSPSGKSAIKTPGAATTDGRSHNIDTPEMQEMIKNLWGELPPNVRPQMLQAPVEDFVPKYENLIEDYYRKLSQEKEGPEKRESKIENR